MNVNYDYYRIFYYVAEFGNITKASEYLIMNQPNVTRTLKNLENEYGCALFVRSNRGVTLTPQGKSLYDHIKIAVTHIEAAESEAKANTSDNSGIVRIGTTEIALRCFLLPILENYRRLYPNVIINLTNCISGQAIEALHDRLVDFAIVTTPFEIIGNMSRKKLSTVNEIAVCGDSFKTLTSGKHSIKELADYPLVSMSTNSSTYTLYRTLFSEYGIPFKPMLEAATADQIIPIVKSNLGIGFIAEDMISKDESGIYKIDIAEELPKRNIEIVRNNNSCFGKAAEKLYEMISNTAK